MFTGLFLLSSKDESLLFLVMEFLLHFHVHSEKKEALVSMLREYSGLEPVHHKELPNDIQDVILCDLNADPDYFIINSSGTGWIGVEFNSFKKLRELGSLISAKLQTRFVQTLYCKEGKYTYFLLYDRGAAIREIESDENYPMPRLNGGALLDFEKNDLGWQEAKQVEDFDLDMLVYYCQEIGIDLSNLWSDSGNIVFDKKGKRETIYNVKTECLKALREIRSSMED